MAGGVHGKGACMAGGVYDRVVCVAGGACMAGGVHGRGAYMAGVCIAGGHAWQERWLLSWMVRILLECIIYTWAAF